MARVSIVNFSERRLLNFTFLIHDMLAHDGVIFFHFQFVGRGTLILVCGVKVSSTSR